jgi:hypothetical protein
MSACCQLLTCKSGILYRKGEDTMKNIALSLIATILIGYMIYDTHMKYRHTESGPALVLCLGLLWLFVICSLLGSLPD